MNVVVFCIFFIVLIMGFLFEGNFFGYELGLGGNS